LKILYLDFDGVLHPEPVHWTPRRGPFLNAALTAAGHTLFEHASMLHALLAPYPDVRIVLSTTWAVHYSCAKAAARLPKELRERVIGATFHSAMDEDAFRALERGQQVLGDVARRRPAMWLAIDDDPQGWRSAGQDHVVISDGTLGISEPQVMAALTLKLTRFA
jgi:hypothetical protein